MKKWILYPYSGGESFENMRLKLEKNNPKELPEGWKWSISKTMLFSNGCSKSHVLVISLLEDILKSSELIKKESQLMNICRYTKYSIESKKIITRDSQNTKLRLINISTRTTAIKRTNKIKKDILANLKKKEIQRNINFRKRGKYLQLKIFEANRKMQLNKSTQMSVAVKTKFCKLPNFKTILGGFGIGSCCSLNSPSIVFLARCCQN